MMLVMKTCFHLRMISSCNVPEGVLLDDSSHHLIQSASVAQWSERSPFTSEVACWILSENVLNATRTDSFTHM